MTETEESLIYRLVIGHAYDADLRKSLAGLGLRRASTQQWVSSSGNRYELTIEEENEVKTVTRLDRLEKDRRVHILDPDSTVFERTAGIHGNTLAAFAHHAEFGEKICSDYIDQWNYEIFRDSAKGHCIRELIPEEKVCFEHLLFLPDPTCRSSSYIFGRIESGKAASARAWLCLPGGEFIMPVDMTEDGAFSSLSSGNDLHGYEAGNFRTPLQAARFCISVLNASGTSYVACIRKLLGKGPENFSTDDFYRNKRGVICRLEVVKEIAGISLREVPVIPTLADCLDSLLSHVIKKNYS